MKVLDDNHLGKALRRLGLLRDVVTVPLPGQALVALDPALGLAIDVVPCDDGHAQERFLLGPVLETVAENDVWVADRNFCTTAFLLGFLLFGEGNVPWVVRELIRRAEPDEACRPLILVAGTA